MSLPKKTGRAEFHSVQRVVDKGNEVAYQAARMLSMLPRYGVYNESGMVETRKAIAAWLGIPITDEQATDARGWSDFIGPHLEKLHSFEFRVKG